VCTRAGGGLWCRVFDRLLRASSGGHGSTLAGRPDIAVGRGWLSCGLARLVGGDRVIRTAAALARIQSSGPDGHQLFHAGDSDSAAVSPSSRLRQSCIQSAAGVGILLNLSA